jgi:hypothetical protein
MAIDINPAQFLVAAKKKGVSFDRVLMLGRQVLHVAPPIMVDLLQRNQLPPDRFKNGQPGSGYAEPLFESLGAKQVDSMDNSDFEGAKLVHDLNQPIPPAWREQYDVVFDGGTMEHVFQFPTALKNGMELVREGGRLMMHTCANNLCGHGFYQFSPELFYRALGADNGFEVERMIVHRMGPYGSWYDVSDPNAIRSRVELISFTPVMMLVQARRTSIKPIFAKPPQQSDYSVLWQNAMPAPVKPENNNFAVLRRFTSAAKTGLEFYKRQSLFNRRFFKKTDKE